MRSIQLKCEQCGVQEVDYDKLWMVDEKPGLTQLYFRCLGCGELITKGLILDQLEKFVSQGVVRLPQRGVNPDAPPIVLDELIGLHEALENEDELRSWLGEPHHNHARLQHEE